MLRIGDSIVSRDDYKIVHKYSGIDELEFMLPVEDPAYKLAKEETVVTAADTDFVIKSVSVGADVAEVKALLDLRDFYSSFDFAFDSGSVTLVELMDAIIPSGWKFVDKSFVSIRRTIQLEKVTPMDKLDAARSTYGVLFIFDRPTKTVTAYSQIPGEPVGAFVTDELNLQELNYFGKSESLITRLYARGKDGLTFSDINDGKDYVDNFEYTDKVICGVWEDDRYTVKESLLADAKSKLAAMARPERSYSCSVINLAKTNPDVYRFQDLSLLNVVTLIDTVHQERVNHQVVEFTEYPHYPERDEIVLSTVAPTIQSQVNAIKDEINNPNSEFNSALNAAINNATENIINASGGYVTFELDSNGKMSEILIMDQPAKENAMKVWRWNLGGLGYSSNGVNGPYTAAITQDGAIVADFITTGSMDAARITAGILRSASGDFTLDLDNSVISVRGDSAFTIASGEFKIQSIINGVAVDAMSMQTVDNDDGTTSTVLRIEDGVQLSDNFILPEENGGTGQSTLDGFADKIGIMSGAWEPDASDGKDGYLWRKYTAAGGTAEYPEAVLNPIPSAGYYRDPGHEGSAHEVYENVTYWNVNRYSANSGGPGCRVGVNDSNINFGVYFEFTFPQASTRVNTITISMPMVRTLSGCGNIYKWDDGVYFKLMRKTGLGLTILQEQFNPAGRTMSSGMLTLTFTGLDIGSGDTLALAGYGKKRNSMVWVNTDGARLHSASVSDDFDMYIKSNGLWKKLALIAYPVGSVYMSVEDTSPADLFGGEWDKIQDRFLVGAGGDYAAGDKGGEASHKHISPVGYNSDNQLFGITYAQGSQSGSFSGSFAATGDKVNMGSGNFSWTLPYTSGASSLPPYYAVNIWKRTK